MRLHQYLNEFYDGDEDIAKKRISLIEKNCQPFLKQMKSINFEDDNLLFSGRWDRTEFTKKKVRKNRRPKDTSIDIHDWVDNWFYKKFGIKARSNTIFCTSHKGYALSYGNLFVIFPIGKFEVIWSSRLKDLFNKADMNRGLEKWSKNFLEFNAKTYKKGDLQGAIKSENEIMLHCKEYYLLKFDPLTNAMVLNYFMETL